MFKAGQRIKVTWLKGENALGAPNTAVGTVDVVQSPATHPNVAGTWLEIIFDHEPGEVYEFEKEAHAGEKHDACVWFEVNNSHDPVVIEAL